MSKRVIDWNLLHMWVATEFTIGVIGVLIVRSDIVVLAWIATNFITVSLLPEA